MKLDIFALIQDDITSIIQRKYHSDTVEYEIFKNHKLPPTNRYWKQTLHEIYTKSPDQYGGGNPPCMDDNPLAKLIGIKGEELKQVTIFLIEHNLISLESHHTWRITKRGFDVALQNENIKNDKTIKYLIVAFMFIPIVISGLELLYKLY